MLQDLAVRDLKTGIFDALARGDNMVWLKNGEDISAIRINAKYISDELAFVTFPKNDKRKGVLIKQASPITFEEHDKQNKEVQAFAKVLRSSPKELEAFRNKEDIALETIYTIPDCRDVNVFIDKPFTGILDKICILGESRDSNRPWFALFFKKKGAKKLYYLDYQFLVSYFLKLPLNKTYRIYKDSAMAYSKGGFNQNIKREYLTMCSVYQLD
jgi:hypothetical protein